MSGFPARAADGDFGPPRNDESFSEDDDSFDVLAHLEATAGGPAPADRSSERYSDRSPESSAERFDDGSFGAGEMSDEGEMADEYGATVSAGGVGATEVTAAAAASSSSGEEFRLDQAHNLEDVLCLQDPPSPLPSPRAASPPRAMPTPMAVPSSAQALRRSPRLAGVPPPPPPEVAAAAAAAARMSAPSAKKVGVSLLGGGDGGCGDASGVTPYSSRRSRRESQRFQTFTPGSAIGDGGMDDQNASFRTAIMGEPSPNSSVGDPGSVLRGPLFEEPLDAQLSTLESEPPTPQRAAGTPPRKSDFSDAVSASPSTSGGGGCVNGRQGLDVDEEGVSSLGERISGLTLGADEDVEDEDKYEDGASFGRDEDVVAGGKCGIVTVASPGAAVAVAGECPVPSAAVNGALVGDFHGRQDMSVDQEPTLPDAAASAAAATAAAAAAADSASGEAGAGSWFEPPSPAVASAPAGGAGNPTFSPKEGASAEVSPYGARAKRAGGMSRSSTFGLSSDDDEEGAAVSFSAAGGASGLTGPSGASGAVGAGVAEMKMPTLPCVKETLVREPNGINASAAEEVEVDGGRDCGAVDGVDGGAEHKKEGEEQEGEKEMRLLNGKQQREVQLDEKGEEGDVVSAGAASDGSPANAIASCLRDVAGGTDTGVDCETSVILDEMLLDAGAGAGLGRGLGLEARSATVGKGNGEGKRKAGDMGEDVASVNGRQRTGAAAAGSGAVVSAVEKEAMALAAACVAEMEGTKALGAARPSLGGAGKEGAGGAAGGEGEAEQSKGKVASMPTGFFGVTAPGKDGTARRRQSGASARRRSSILPGAIAPGAARAPATKSTLAAGSGEAASSATAAKASASAKVTAAAEAASVRVAAAAEAAAARVKAAKAAATRSAELKAAAAAMAAKEKAAAIASAMAAKEKSAAIASAMAAKEKAAALAAAKAVAAAEAAASAAATKEAASAETTVPALQPVAADTGVKGGADAAPIAAATASIKKVDASPTRRGRASGKRPTASVTGVSASATASVGAGESGSAAGSASRSVSPRVSISRIPSPARSRRASGVSRRDSGRMSFGGPPAASSTAAVLPGAVVGQVAAATRAVDVRQQSLAIGTRVPDVAPARGGPVKAVAAAVTSSVAGSGPAMGGAKRPTSRGRDRGARDTGSGGGGGAGFGRRRDSGVGVGGGAGVAAAGADTPVAPVVAAVAPSSRLLAPTAVSQGRARPRSASPAVAAVRGRASSGGFGSGPSGAAGGGRRLSSAGASQPAGHKQKPRSQSTGRRPLTQPKTPNFRTTYRFKADKPQETTEEVEFKKQQAMQEDMKQMTRRNQAMMERSRRTAYSGNVRSSKPLTVPESPAMKTIGRLGGKVYAAVGPQAEQAGFSPTHPARGNALLKEHEVLAQEKPKGPTVPAPFHLSKSNRSDKAPGSAPGTPRTREETLTFRESLARIENKTPDRFRSRPAGDHAQPAPVAHVEPKPTLPVSPKFRTEARAAGHVKSHLPSREQREEAELADMKKHQFKARPYNPDGFGVGGEQGVFRPQHSDKTLTQPAPFRLSTDGRASKRAPSPHRSRDEEELSKQFKARPLPTGRSSSVGRVRPGANVGPGSSAELKPRGVVKPKSLTVAESPMLSTKRRSAMRSGSVGGPGQTSEQVELDEAAAKQFRARPMPNYSKMSSQARRQTVTLGDQPAAPTETRPFHLRSEERGKAKQALLAQRLLTQRRQEEAAAKVRARPLPAPSQGFFPQPSERPLTETAEFVLSSQTRHERAAQEFRDRVRMEEERARRATQVVALPLPAATFEPELYPERTELSLTQPVERVLHSSARAEGRAKWEENNQARIEAEETARVDLVKATAAAEKRAIAELRRRSHAEGGMAFKAKAIKWAPTAPDCSQLSTAPLTTPITPNLRTKRRAMNAAPLDAPIA